jgi:hypothetical protein
LGSGKGDWHRDDDCPAATFATSISKVTPFASSISIVATFASTISVVTTIGTSWWGRGIRGTSTPDGGATPVVGRGPAVVGVARVLCRPVPHGWLIFDFDMECIEVLDVTCTANS